MDKDNFLNLAGLIQFYNKLKTIFAMKDELTNLKGEQGVSITSVEQTTSSTVDGGTNVITVTLSDGTTSTFNIRNGTKGAAGINATTTAVATTSANGLMSKEMVQKLGTIDGITSDISSNSDTIAASSKMVHDLNDSLSGEAYTAKWIPCYYITGFGMVVIIPKFTNGQKLKVTSSRVYNGTSWIATTANNPGDLGTAFAVSLSGNFNGIAQSSVYLCEMSYTLS